MKVELLTPIDWLKKQLEIIELAGRTCYQSHKGEITQETAKKFISMLLKRGHESVIEHSNMTVKFSGVSRGLTHELVRHRLCAFSQESTRYVDKKNFQMILPPPIKNKWTNISSISDIEDIITLFREIYTFLRENGWKVEDARQFLPIGISNEIVVSTNFREWRHIFKMRTQKAAHWEIRLAMVELLNKVQHHLSPIFSCFILEGRDSREIAYYKMVKE